MRSETQIVVIKVRQTETCLILDVGDDDDDEDYCDDYYDNYYMTTIMTTVMTTVGIRHQASAAYVSAGSASAYWHKCSKLYPTTRIPLY